nr:small cell adhesion glycoprotein isoform X1 [Anas platyrhynchos]
MRKIRSCRSPDPRLEGAGSARADAMEGAQPPLAAEELTTPGLKKAHTPPLHEDANTAVIAETKAATSPTSSRRPRPRCRCRWRTPPPRRRRSISSEPPPGPARTPLLHSGLMPCGLKLSESGI